METVKCGTWMDSEFVEVSVRESRDSRAFNTVAAGKFTDIGRDFAARIEVVRVVGACDGLVERVRDA